jgi:sec-independent protein translocase protein TatB
MFGIGPLELVVIAIVAVLLFGPDRLPEFARTAGRLLRQVRQMVNNAQNDLRNELGPEFADLDVRDLNRAASSASTCSRAWTTTTTTSRSRPRWT